MQIWTDISRHAERAEIFHGAALTMGNFDGLHLGHQTLVKTAARLPGPTVVITFDPHPVQVLYPERRLRRLFPRADLAEQLPQYGVDLLVILRFTRDFSQLSSQQFLRAYLEAPFRPRHLVAGYDFAFGQSRSGTLASLREWSTSHGATLHQVPPVELGGEIVSSGRIRKLVENGDVPEASTLLGRPFYLRGPVGTGAGRGTKLGFPTLNQNVENEVLPALGVYATRVRWKGTALPAVTNVGVNPTFGGESRVKVETHVLSGSIEARGEQIDVDFIERLRPELRFPGIEDLKKQIGADILKAKRIHGM
ncbi:MAG: bifunctional riboflavin kinase/FAD synthetase [Bdellovibrionales bacterium]